MSQFPCHFVPQRPPASPIIPLPFFYSPPPPTFRAFVSAIILFPCSLQVISCPSLSPQSCCSPPPLTSYLVLLDLSQIILSSLPVPPPHIWLSTGQVLLESPELSIWKCHPTLEQQGPEKSNFVKQSSELEVYTLELMNYSVCFFFCRWYNHYWLGCFHEHSNVRDWFSGTRSQEA